MAPEDQGRRKQILDAAQQVFAQKGFEGASIKDLAKAAKISPGLLYWYFKDKTDLFVSLLSERMETVFGSLTEHISFDLPPEEFLPQFGRFYVGIFESPLNAALFKVMVTNSQSFPAAVRQVDTKLIGRVLGMLQDYFRHQIDAGQMRPCNTEMVARAFMGGLVTFLLLKHIWQDTQAQELPVEKLVDGIVDVVLHGVLPADK